LDSLREVSEEWRSFYDAADALRCTRGPHASIAAAARRLHAFANAGEEYEAGRECRTAVGKLVYQSIPPGKLGEIVAADALALAARLMERGYNIRFDYGARVTTVSEYDRITGERCFVVFTGTRRSQFDPGGGVCVACHLHFRRVRPVKQTAAPSPDPEPRGADDVEESGPAPSKKTLRVAAAIPKAEVMDPVNAGLSDEALSDVVAHILGEPVSPKAIAKARDFLKSS
jgi:hypothetical protein